MERADSNTAKQVELATGSLEELSIPPCVAASLLAGPAAELSKSGLADIIESDPALALKAVSLIRSKNLDLQYDRYSLRRTLDRIDVHEIRDAVLTVPVAGRGNDLGPDIVASQTDMLVHSVAVACCSREIASIVGPPINADLAYLAGLMHDLGKLALAHIMPRGFARIIEQACAKGVCSCEVETEHLGCDHTIVGKHLAARWQLPSEVVMAAWLHHSDTDAVCEIVPEAAIARIVQLADVIVRRAGIGSSGSFDTPGSPDDLARSVSISVEQMIAIHQRLDGAVQGKAQILGLDIEDALSAAYDASRSAAAVLSSENTRLSGENTRLRTDANHLSFVTHLLCTTDSASTAIDIAGKFAAGFQKCFETGRVCVYLPGPNADAAVDVIVLEPLGEILCIAVDPPEGEGPVPRSIAGKFGLVDARDHCDWLFDQLDPDFDRDAAKIAPLLSKGRAVGAIIFELYYRRDVELFERSFKSVTSIAGTVLDMAAASKRQEYLAEQFVKLVKKPTGVKPRDNDYQLLEAFTEMAAGAAHELNNPLSVISGRAQLLADAESDQQKKELLGQIQQNSLKAAAMIEGLMAYAQPPEPRRERAEVRGLIDEALQLASQKQNVQHIDLAVNVDEEMPPVMVDSAQVASALANVVSNAVDSYDNHPGSIDVAARLEAGGDYVAIETADSGCGMDGEVLRKATHPFFSAKPAGRKPGMGLAFALRFVQINNGTLDMRSRPGAGTTVTIRLPVAGR